MSRRSQHNLECIELGQALGSKALTVWIADGANFAGQQHLTRALRALPGEHGPDLRRPARRLADVPGAQALRARLLRHRDRRLGHVLPRRQPARAQGQVPGRPRPPRAGRQHRADRRPADRIRRSLAGFHFNDSKYGDDDLDSGSIDPFRLFLVFHELVSAAAEGRPGFAPAYMMDQSHNVTDPIESLMAECRGAAARPRAGAAGRPRRRWPASQDGNDALMALATLQRAFTTDVAPDPGDGAAACRAARSTRSGCTGPAATGPRKHAERPQVAQLGGGIKSWG